MEQQSHSKVLSGLHLALGVLLAATFFMPWVSWAGHPVTGSAMVTGQFFKISETEFKLGNPFPKLSFTFYIFWIIPLLGVICAAFSILKKKTIPLCYIAGAASLALLIIYYLFTKTLIDLGVGENVFRMLKPAAYLHAVAAIGLIFTAQPAKVWLPKVFWLLVGPVIAYASFKFIEKKTMSETHTATEKVKADYTLAADTLIREFLANDTATNKKYNDKMLVVNGRVSKIELLDDSTSTISFADSTGSYAIFSLEKNQYDRVKGIKQGDAVSLKGVCSGSIYSEILGTTAITFKRATFNSDK